MKKLKLFFMFSLVFVIIACSNQSHDTEMANEVAMDGDMSTSKSYGGERGIEEMEMAEEAVMMDSAVSNDNRKVIYHGNFMIEVKDYQKARDEIQKKVTSVGGYIVDSYYYEQGENQPSGSMVLRLPKQEFQPMISQLVASDWKIIEQQTSGNDVTEEYVDLESRLKAKRVVEERLLSFMNDATNTENLLKISKELAQVQAEIEQMLGRKQYLNNQVEYATLSIHIQENSLATSIQSEDLNTWDRSKKLFIDTINVLIKASSSVFVFLIGLSPVIIPIAFLLFIFIYTRKKNQKLNQ
ncbi:DUF4349 domain-containing protein [Halalkalibacter akibai]|nr:DUF4349 domain-containing protein [Halalkalibacter akibai]